MPAAKSLVEHVLDRTFRADKHAELLNVELLPEEAPIRQASKAIRRSWGNLREVQRAVVGKDATAFDFAAAIKDFHAARTRPFSLAEMLWATVGPRITYLDPKRNVEREEWQAWNERYGTPWRVQHGLSTSSDRIRLVYGEDAGDVRVPPLPDELPDWVLEPAPNPPRWDEIT